MAVVACLVAFGSPDAVADTTKAKAKAKPATKSTAKTTATRSVSARRAPPPPAAVLPPAIDTMLSHGCLQSRGYVVRTRLTDTEQAFDDFVRTVSSPDRQVDDACLNFAAALRAEGHGSTFALWSGSPGQPSLTFLHRDAGSDGVVARHVELELARERRRELDMAALDASVPGHPALETLAEHLRWQLDVLVRKMHVVFGIGPTHRLRVVLDSPAGGGRERIAAIELSDGATGRLVESVLWLDRAEGPGAFFSTSATDYERAAWLSPVKEARASRGVGQGSVTVRRTVSSKGGDKKGAVQTVRTASHRGHHIGIDFVAPTGTPVHAVADAEVSFVGRKGGYGNLVILDHGSGHQTYYAHLSAFAAGLAPGTKVLRGEMLGRVGSTGFSTGPHLHYEVRKDGNYIDAVLAQNRLAYWNLHSQDHEHLLAHLVVLDLTRRPEAAQFILARKPAPAATPGALAAEDP
jgi:murein DD-endopeptidase MepM/ murein hydrolase activator NlpD